MTIEELYKWAVENNCTDYKLYVQYRDEGGDYLGADSELYLSKDNEDKTITL